MSFKKSVCTLWTTACLILIYLLNIHMYNVMPHNYVIKHEFLKNPSSVEDKIFIHLEQKEGRHIDSSRGTKFTEE